MKGFVASLLVFTVLLGVIVWNYFYITSICDDLTTQLHDLPAVSEAYEAATALFETWEREKGKISISVSLHTLDKLSEILAEMQYAVSHKDAASFEKCRAVALQIVGEIKHTEGLSAENWI